MTDEVWNLDERLKSGFWTKSKSQEEEDGNGLGVAAITCGESCFRGEPIQEVKLNKNAWVCMSETPDSPTVMADTGFEHQRPISAADFAQCGIGLTVVRNAKRTNSSEVCRSPLSRGISPSA